MAVRVYRLRGQLLSPSVKLVLLYVQLTVASLSLAGVGFLLWFYAHQNALVVEVFQEVTSQVNAKGPLTPADLGDLTHQVCVLDSRISAKESFFQPLAATLSGGGWCGNYVRVFIRFADEAGYPAHKLHIQSGGRSHTLAEVYYDGKWRVIDPFFNQVYLHPAGEMATFQDINEDPGLLDTPVQRPLNDPRLGRIYQSYVPILPDLYRDAANFYPALSDSAFYHNAIVILSYPLSAFYEGGRRPFLPNWLDRQELLGVYVLSIIFVMAAGPIGVNLIKRKSNLR
jgi:hypothetical protein